MYTCSYTWHCSSLCSAKRIRKSGKFKEVDEREEEEESEEKDKPIKIMSDETDSNKLLSPDLAKTSGDLQNGSGRSGASSPSPSDGM